MNTCVWAGIDPGKSGAIAFINHFDGRDVDVQVYPMAVLKSGKGREEYDLPAITALLRGWLTPGASFISLEKGQPLPASMGGGIANFARGYSRGLFEGLFVALGLRYQLVAPRTWQAVMLAGTSGSDTKQRSIIAASRLFPSVSLLPTPRSKKPSSDYSDALLLACYARRVCGGSE